MGNYIPNVERWRDLLAKYFPPHLVDKALYVIQGESGGNPEAIGDSGVAIGLFQIHSSDSIPGRPSKGALLDPETNIRFAAESLGAAGGNWSAWGEGTENLPPYDPATGRGRFGVLGNFPYSGDIDSDAPAVSRSAGNNTTAIPVSLPFDIPIPGTGWFTAPGGFIKDAAGNLVPGFATDAAGNIVDATGKIIGSVGKGLTATASVLAQVGRGLTWLLDPHHWLRLFFLASGAVLFILGGYVYLRGDHIGEDAAKAASVA